MSELSKAERIRNARAVYDNRKQDRPVQLAAPTSDHVVGWKWQKVGDHTLTDLEEDIEELEDA